MSELFHEPGNQNQRATGARCRCRRNSLLSKQTFIHGADDTSKNSSSRHRGFVVVSVNSCEAMFLLRCVKPSTHLPFQSRGCWVAAMSVGTSKVTTAADELALKHPSNRYIQCHNFSVVIRLAALLQADPTRHQLCKKKQVVAVRPATSLGLRGVCELVNLKWVPSDSRTMFVKGKNRGNDSGDLDLFEEWLKVNPLPDVSPQEVSRRSNGGPDFDVHDESTVSAGDCQQGANEKSRDGKNFTGESGESDMLPETNRMPVGEMGLSNIRNFDQLFAKVNVVLNGPAKISGPQLGELGYLREFSWEETGDLLYECLCECNDLAWDCEQKKFLEVNPSRGGWRIEFIPPLIQPPLSSCCTPREYLQSLHQRRERRGNKQLLALLSSNAAALAIFDGGELLLHKVITAYTVRAKQGKSQLKFLRQGGPGRMTVGGAIRAREADRFSTRVCEKLVEWGNEIQDCEVLFFSGTTRVWNEIYAADNSKVLVSRNDSRWCKVPFNVHEPRLREVKRVFYRLSHGAVGFSWNID